MATPQQSAVHSVRFPHESDSYRAARNDLLRAELALRKQIEAVAELRRTLPLGGVVPQDYSFEEGAAETDKVSASHTVRLSELSSAPAKIHWWFTALLRFKYLQP
jgi:predicted dithiol-disulfide oxidoreductase (DUF899 family)